MKEANITQSKRCAPQALFGRGSVLAWVTKVEETDHRHVGNGNFKGAVAALSGQGCMLNDRKGNGFHTVRWQIDMLPAPWEL